VLLVGFLIYGGRYYTEKRESQRLRDTMLAQEQKAREMLETKNVQLEHANKQIEARNVEIHQSYRQIQEAKEHAEMTNRAQSIFLANMSHEIRTPLNAILGYAQILQRAGDLQLRQRAAIQTIFDSGQHLLGLINDVLDPSKIEAGRLELQETDFDLSMLIAGLSTMFALRCDQKGPFWQVEWEENEQMSQSANEQSSNQVNPTPAIRHPQSVWVHGDENKLRQVLINLLGNAVKFTESGTVTLRITHYASRFAFHVIDTGIGIPPEEVGRIFEPFSRSRSKHLNEGTGLGLTIAQKHVELMDGKLEVESTPGAGSRFCFTIPLKPPTQRAIASRRLRISSCWMS